MEGDLVLQELWALGNVIGLVFVGIDVSANKLVVAIEREQLGRKRREFPNRQPGHKSLVR
jgi:hypothetical protein